MTSTFPQPAEGQPLETVWSEADLVRRLGRALEFGSRAVAALGLEGHSDTQDAEVSVHGRKPTIAACHPMALL